MASFTTVGDTTTLSVADMNESVTIALSGTYTMTIDFQRELGSPGSGSWETVKTYSTADATVSDIYYTKSFKENLRLFLRVDGGGTCTCSLTNTTQELLFEHQDRVGNSLYKIYQGAFVPVQTPVDLTATVTLTEAKHAFRPLLLDAAAGFTVTLPAATGTGNIYEFFVHTTLTSGSYIIQVANATDVIQGTALINLTGAATVESYEAASTSDTITLQFADPSTGTTKGGWIRLRDVAAGYFYCQAILHGDGASATVWSAAVS